MLHRTRIRDEADAATSFQDGAHGFDERRGFFRWHGGEDAGVAGAAAGFVVAAFTASAGAGDVAKDGVAAHVLLTQDGEQGGEFRGVDDDFDAFDLLHGN